MRKSWRKILALAGILFLMAPLRIWAADILLYFPPEWKGKGPQAKAIAEALGKGSGQAIEPRIVNSYPQIVQDFARNQPMLVYVGSFAQALLYERGLSAPIVQGVDGKEFYTSILVAPAAAGEDPSAIVAAAGDKVAYTKGASSGESGAKAATAGKAAIATTSHQLAVNAVETGTAKCAFVKNFWWDANKGKFVTLKSFEYPGVSEYKHADNVISANKAVTPEQVAKIKAAAMNLAEVFGVQSFREFDAASLKPTLELMQKAKIDPKTYSW